MGNINHLLQVRRRSHLSLSTSLLIIALDRLAGRSSTVAQRLALKQSQLDAEAHDERFNHRTLKKADSNECLNGEYRRSVESVRKNVIVW